MRALRWLLVVPGAIASWYLTFVLGMVTYAILEKALCPPTDWWSDTCYSSEVDRQLEWVIHAFVGLSAVAVVSTAALIAPSRTKAVAWSAYVVGGVAACSFGIAVEAPLDTLAALGSGLITTVAITKRVSAREQGPSRGAAESGSE